MSDKKIRIGCASAFYGDSQLAARQLVEKGAIDYLVFDYLAEVTMAILAHAKINNSDLGYAVDFVTVAMADVLEDCAKKGIKVIANAGGVNVPGCITALQQLCESRGLELNIAGIYGDDLSGCVEQLCDYNDLSDMQTAKALPQRLTSINAYLGAQPIVAALAVGADVIVTGRVVDSAVVIAPLIHEFKWPANHYDLLAQAALAGHIIECGAQCTGGNFTDWQLVPDFSEMSYPIVEVSSDGNFEVQIPPNTGGLVTLATVAEQIVYEIGDPANYLLPDVACDFSQVKLEQLDINRVLVRGAKGRAPGNQYKVCATYVDGYKLMSSFFMGGLNSADKARTSLQAWVKRCRKVFAVKGWEDFRQVSIEIVGAEDTYGPHALGQNTREVMGKCGLHHNNKLALQFASMEMAYLATSGPPGMSGFGAGRVKPQPLMKLHSALLDKNHVLVKVQLNNAVIIEQVFVTPEHSQNSSPSTFSPQAIFCAPNPADKFISVPLLRLAYARSGDKGNNANVGVILRDAKYLPYVYQQLSAEKVAAYFSHLLEGEVTRFELPGFNAFNFLMTEALGGGGTASVRLDSQGKAFAQMLLSMQIDVPDHLFEEN